MYVAILKITRESLLYMHLYVNSYQRSVVTYISDIYYIKILPVIYWDFFYIMLDSVLETYSGHHPLKWPLLLIPQVDTQTQKLQFHNEIKLTLN